MRENQAFRHPCTYNRVSKEEQSRDKDALKRMMFHSDRALERLGFNPESIPKFVDIQSGRDDARADFEKLIDLIKSGQVDLLILYRIDRFTRRIATNVNLAELLEEKNVKVFEIVSDRFYDLSQRGDWEAFITAGVKAESEVRELSARTRLGLEFSRHQGKHVGKIPFGYVRVNGFLRFDENPFTGNEEGLTVIEVARLAHKILRAGHSVRESAREVYDRVGWKIHPSSLYRWAKNILLQGHTEIDGEIHFNTHPALISHQEAKELDDNYSEPKSRFNNTFKQREIHLFSGLVFCAKCGGRVHSKLTKNGGKDRIYYRCRNRAEKDKDSPCSRLPRQYGKTAITEEDLERYAIASIIQKAEDIGNRAIAEEASKEEFDPEILKIKRQIKQLQKMVLDCGDDFGLLGQQIALLESQIAKRRSLPLEIDEAKREEILRLAANPSVWIDLSRDEKKRLYRWLIKKIVVDANNVTSLDFTQF